MGKSLLKAISQQILKIRRKFFGDFPIELLDYGFECGPICLKMISNYYGKEYELAYLARISKMDNIEGTSLRGLIEGAELIGFKALAIRVPYRSKNIKKPGLIDAPLPCIMHWRGDSFVIVYHISQDQIYIANPFVGKQKYSVNEFVDNWIEANDVNDKKEGIALLLEPQN